MTDEKAIEKMKEVLAILDNVNDELDRLQIAHILEMERRGYTTPYCDY